MLFREFRYTIIFLFMGLMGSSSLLGMVPPTKTHVEKIVENYLKKNLNLEVLPTITEAQSQAQQFIGESQETLRGVQQSVKAVEAAVPRLFDNVQDRINQAAITQAAGVARVQEEAKLQGAARLTLEQEKARAQAYTTDPTVRKMHDDMAAKQKETAVATKEAEVKAMKDNGVYDKQNETAVKMNETKWSSIKNMFGSIGSGLTSPKTMFKVGLGILICGIAYYGIKHAMPVIIAKMVQPTVVSETSKKSWFGSKNPKKDLNLEELVFTGDLKTQLRRVTDAVEDGLKGAELPNVLLHGKPGLGKTIFAKAVAYHFKGKVDYALTSATEFAALPTLELKKKHLRRLIEWAERNGKILILFWDEVESLFADRRLPTTSRETADFILSFCHLVPKKSQKNFMIIFATNYPYMIDEAIGNRIGMDIAFDNPSESGCVDILKTYVTKFSKADGKQAVVSLDSGVDAKIASSGKNLVGLTPRALDFTAQQMMTLARRTPTNVLTMAMVDEAIAIAKKDEARMEIRRAEREQYRKTLVATH